MSLLEGIFIGVILYFGVWVSYIVYKFTNKAHQEQNITLSNLKGTVIRLIHNTFIVGIVLTLLYSGIYWISLKSRFSLSTFVLFLPLCFFIPFVLSFGWFGIRFLNLKIAYKYNIVEENE